MSTADVGQTLPTAISDCAVAVLANDKVFAWLLPFLESYRASNCGIPLHVIPFDDSVSRTRNAAEVYGATMFEGDMSRVDALARQLYPFFRTIVGGCASCRR